MTDFDADRLGEYRDMLGSAALNRLWREFSADTEKFFAFAAGLKREELRLEFHNLRAGALVFGLRAFSASCAVLEEAVMKEISAADLAAEIKTAQKTFANQSAEVDAFLE